MWPVLCRYVHAPVCASVGAGGDKKCVTECTRLCPWACTDWCVLRGDVSAGPERPGWAAQRAGLRAPRPTPTPAPAPFSPRRRRRQARGRAG